MEEDKNIICSWLFIFGFAFAFFHIIPSLLQGFLTRPLTWGDALDFLTPFVVIPLVYILYLRIKNISMLSQVSKTLHKSQMIFAKVLLAFGSLLYVDGHGLHLSANSIARLIQSMKESELFKSVYLYDEIISHSMWDSGIFIISIGFILFSNKLSFKPLRPKNTVLLFLGAAFYGFTFTVNAIEGQTTIFTFPGAFLAFLLVFFLYLKRIKQRTQNPVLFFFLIAYLISTLLFLYWGMSHSGFPQFSELGWI